MASEKEKTDMPAGITKESAPAPVLAAEEYPDPDEDDLDDLDDVLDEFSSTPQASGPGRPGGSAVAAVAPPTVAASSAKAAPAAQLTTDTSTDGARPSENDAEAFAAQLQKEMAALMGEIDNSPEMQQQLDAMMAELSTGAAPSKSTATDAAGGTKDGGGAAKAAAASGEANFQETIRRTMERMQASGEQAGAEAAAGAGGETDMLEALLREMATAGGDGGEEEFSQMLLGMMEQLTNKEILYEPMKDLHTKFPAWIKEHEGKIDKADWDRYIEQQRLVAEIVARFEREGYSDENAEDREYIVERMQKMQAAGSPPADLVGDMKETQDALGDLDGGCAPQ